MPITIEFFAEQYASFGLLFRSSKKMVINFIGSYKIEKRKKVSLEYFVT